MDFLESMTIEQLVSLNQDIQKVLKEKRKARAMTYEEEKFGKRIKIGIEYNPDGTPKELFLKARQRYPQDCFITILDNDPENFKDDIWELYESITKACKHVRGTNIGPKYLKYFKDKGENS